MQLVMTENIEWFYGRGLNFSALTLLLHKDFFRLGHFVSPIAKITKIKLVRLKRSNYILFYVLCLVLIKTSYFTVNLHFSNQFDRAVLN